MKKIGLIEIKQALLDHRFRDILPLEIREEVAKFLENPGCPCNKPLYNKIASSCQKQLLQYFPESEVISNDKIEIKNNFSVINCSISDLESKLRVLPPGNKQITIARWQDQCTVIINNIDI